MTEKNEPQERQEPSGQGQPQGVEPEVGTAETPEVGGGAPTSLGTVTLLGREYDLSKPDQVQELVKDYDRLGRQYAPLTQRLADLEAMLKDVQQNSSPDFSDPETVEYLRKLGFVHREELSQEKEDQALENTLKSLENTYSGKDGRPKFDRRAVLEFCIQNGISNPEYGYKIMNWDALKEWELRQAKSAPAAPPSSGGEGGPRQPQPKRRVFGPPGEDEVSLREAMLETLEQSASTPTA